MRLNCERNICWTFHKKYSCNTYIIPYFLYLCAVPSIVLLMWNGNHIWIRRLLNALFLTLRNLANFNLCQEWSNSRCSWICHIWCRIFNCTMYLYTYRRGLLRCSFNRDGQCESLRSVGRVIVRLPRFFIYVIPIFLNVAKKESH